MADGRILHVKHGDDMWDADLSLLGFQTTDAGVYPFVDCPDCGRLHDAGDLQALFETRLDWVHGLRRTGRRRMRRVVAREAGQMVESFRQICSAARIVVWAGTSVQEQCYAAMATAILARVGAAPDKLVYVGVNRPRSAHLTDDDLANATPVPMPDALYQGWLALCSDKDTALADFVHAGHAHAPLNRAFRHLLRRRPEPTSGLGSIERTILETATNDWQSAITVTINACFRLKQTLDQVGDMIVADRLLDLADPSLPSPPLELRGDIRNCVEREVRLSDFGRACLAGEANHVTTNGIDHWFGGVHLKVSPAPR